MAKKFGLNTLIALAVVLSSIAVGDALRVGVLAVPFVGATVNMIVGWIVIASGLISALDMLGLKLLKI